MESCIATNNGRAPDRGVVVPWLVLSIGMLSLGACQTVVTGNGAATQASAPAPRASALHRVITPEIEQRARDESRLRARPSPAQAVADYRRRRDERLRSVAKADRTSAVATPPSAPAAAPATVAPVAVPAVPGVAGATAAPAAIAPEAPATPVDLAALERSGSGFAGIFGSMTGLVKHCAGRQVAPSHAETEFQAAFEARDGAGRPDVPATARQTFEQHARGIGATGVVDCGYVRSSAPAWGSLANDVRNLSADSAEQFRKGLVYELRRATSQ